MVRRDLAPPNSKHTAYSSVQASNTYYTTSLLHYNIRAWYAGIGQLSPAAEAGTESVDGLPGDQSRMRRSGHRAQGSTHPQRKPAPRALLDSRVTVTDASFRVRRSTAAVRPSKSPLTMGKTPVEKWNYKNDDDYNYRGTVGHNIVQLHLASVLACWASIR